MRQLFLALLFVVGLAGCAASVVEADSFDLNRLNDGGYVVMMRHASAPGTGDPFDVVIGDCATQRNLGAQGRADSKRLGDMFKAAGIRPAKIYTSQWCRCVDTAVLMDLGPVTEFDGLNSFFTLRQNKGPNLAKLGELFRALPLDGDPVIMVTHQVTITAVTGEWAYEGESMVLKLNGTSAPELIGRIGLPASGG